MVGVLGGFTTFSSFGYATLQLTRDGEMGRALVNIAANVVAGLATGVLGYGASSRLHSAKFLELSTDLPVMIEIVDVAERIDAFLPKIHEMVTEGLVTIERVEVLAHRGRSGPR